MSETSEESILDNIKKGNGLPPLPDNSGSSEQSGLTVEHRGGSESSRKTSKRD